METHFLSVRHVPHNPMRAVMVVDVAMSGGMKPPELVAEAARLQGLLSLPFDGEVSHLAEVLPAGGGRVVLDDEATHGSYRLVVGRIIGIWHADDPLAHDLYRGR